MGNGLRFPYLPRTELWGRGQRARAGAGRTGASGVSAGEANPPPQGEDAMRTEGVVGKRASWPPRKAAMAPRQPVP